MTPLEQLVLQVVGSQSDGYLISPDASAFVAEGLVNLEQVNEALVSLQDQRFVEFFTDEETATILKVIKDENGAPLLENGVPVPELTEDGKTQTEEVSHVMDSGWAATDSGKKALADYGN